MSSNPLILVVDDDPIQREIASEFLRGNGFECVTAADGEVALEQMRLAPADVVVLDMIMPRKEGIETLREIKNRWPGTPVMMISGGTRAMGATPLLGTARALGADAVQHKPLNEEIFIAQICRLIAEGPGLRPSPTHLRG